MGTLSSTDRRFDKPALDALVDLLNHSNKSHIRYGEISADNVESIVGLEAIPVNTSVRIRLKDAPENAPSTTVAYQRLDLGDFVDEAAFFTYLDGMSVALLYEQLRQFHGVYLTPEDSSLILGQVDADGLRTVTFVPHDGHFVWYGQLTVEAGPQDHLRGLIVENQLNGFTREALAS